MTKDFIKYLFVRGVGVLMYMGLLIFLVEIIKIAPVVSAMIAFIIVFLLNYMVSYQWIFKSAHSHRRTFARYIGAVVVSFILNTGIMYLTVNIWGWWYIWGQASTALIIPPTNFLIHKYWSFK